jgi:hypothetical protein
LAAWVVVISAGSSARPTILRICGLVRMRAGNPRLQSARDRLSHPVLRLAPPMRREAIREAGCAVDMVPMSTTGAIRAAVPVAAAAAGAVTIVSQSLHWDIARYTRMPITKFQKWLYEQNPKWHFCDETICVLWCVEFPDAKSGYPANLHYIDRTLRERHAWRTTGAAECQVVRREQ